MGFTLLNPVHLLFINLDDRLLPGAGPRAWRRAEPDVMDRPPRPASRAAFSPADWALTSSYQGVLITVTHARVLYRRTLHGGRAFSRCRTGVSHHGMTMAFLTMSMCEIFHSFNMRSQRRMPCSRLPGHNKVLWAAMIGSLILTTVVLEVPVLSRTPSASRPWRWTEYGIALASGRAGDPRGGAREGRTARRGAPPGAITLASGARL